MYIIYGDGFDTAQFSIMAYAIDIQTTETYREFKSNFIRTAFILKNSNRNWYSQNQDFVKSSVFAGCIATAYKLSLSDTVSED